MSRSAGALKLDLVRRTTSARRTPRAAHTRSRCAKKPFVPSLPLEMIPTVLPSEANESAAPAAAQMAARSRWWDPAPETPCRQFNPAVAAVNADAAIGSVTARLSCRAKAGSPPRIARGTTRRDNQQLIRRIQRGVLGVAAIAHHRALAALGPLPAMDARAGVDEGGDVRLAPARRLQVLAQLLRDDQRIVAAPESNNAACWRASPRRRFPGSPPAPSSTRS